MSKFILNYVDEGNGEVVLLLAGLLASTRYWSEIIQKLKITNRVLAFDQLGFGLSPKPNKFTDYSIEDNIDSYKATLDSLGIKEKIKIVGYSSSSILALSFAAKYPELVKDILLITPPVHLTRVSSETFVYKSFRTYKLFLGQSKLKFFFKWFIQIFRPILYLAAPLFITHVPPETARDVFRCTWKSLNNTIENIIINQNVIADLKKIKAPIKILYAEKDSIVSEENLIKLVQQFPTIQLEKLNCTHQIPQEMPDKIIELVAN